MRTITEYTSYTWETVRTWINLGQFDTINRLIPLTVILLSSAKSTFLSDFVIHCILRAASTKDFQLSPVGTPDYELSVTKTKKSWFINMIITQKKQVGTTHELFCFFVRRRRYCEPCMYWIKDRWSPQYIFDWIICVHGLMLIVKYGK